MERENIIVVPYGFEPAFTAVNEAMEDMYLVRTVNYGTVHRFCVIAKPEEVLPLACAYCDITFISDPYHRPKEGEDNKSWENRINTEWMGIQGERKGKHLHFTAQDATIDIFYMRSYPMGSYAVRKYGNYVLCSQWGYKKIMAWYED